MRTRKQSVPNGLPTGRVEATKLPVAGHVHAAWMRGTGMQDACDGRSSPVDADMRARQARGGGSGGAPLSADRAKRSADGQDAAATA